MNRKRTKPIGRFVYLTLILCMLPSGLMAQERRTLTFADLMKFRQVQNASISDDGGWIAFTADPDRGDGEVIVRSTNGATRYVVPLGARPVISADAAWVAIIDADTNEIDIIAILFISQDTVNVKTTSCYLNFSSEGVINKLQSMRNRSSVVSDDI